MTTLAELENQILNEFPDYKLVPKANSRFMRLIGFLLKVITFGKANAFMDHFVTTIRWTVYTPSRWDGYIEGTKISVLSHERVHMRQCRKHGFLLYSFLYLFFPLPVLLSYYRSKFEREAYEESMRMAAYYYGVSRLNESEYRTAMIENFTGAAYFWMWVRRSDIERWYDRTVAKIRTENISSFS